VKSYSELFDQRGSSYDIAMRRYPAARRAEFRQILEPLTIAPGMRIGDVPAGGGYLQAHLPPGAIWEGHEPCASFTNHGEVSAAESHPLLPLPWADRALDAVLSLAGVHHLEDKTGLFAEVGRVLKPGGTFVLSDVAEDTPVARFLDGFVGNHNSTGHEGCFLGERTLQELRATGWRVLSADHRRFTWDFADRAEMGDFASHLFDICKASAAQTADAIERELGTVPLPGGGVGMNWSLMTICCQRP
jgi:SAM-dependent methyltransferase